MLSSKFGKVELLVVCRTVLKMVKAGLAGLHRYSFNPLLHHYPGEVNTSGVFVHLRDDGLPLVKIFVGKFFDIEGDASDWALLGRVGRGRVANDVVFAIIHEELFVAGIEATWALITIVAFYWPHKVLEGKLASPTTVANSVEYVEDLRGYPTNFMAFS